MDISRIDPNTRRWLVTGEDDEGLSFLGHSDGRQRVTVIPSAYSPGGVCISSSDAQTGENFGTFWLDRDALALFVRYAATVLAPVAVGDDAGGER